MALPSAILSRIRGGGGRAFNRLASRFQQALTNKPWSGYLEPLEPRIYLNGQPPGHILAEFAGQIDDANDTDQVALSILADNFTPNRLGTVGLGFRVIAEDGSPLDPATVGIRDDTGAPVNPHFANDDLADGQSLALAELTQGQYTLSVASQQGTSGAYRLEAYLIGDADGSGNVDRRADALIMRQVFGSQVGGGQYLPEADANLDGRITSFDMAQYTRNIQVQAMVELDPVDEPQPPALDPIDDQEVDEGQMVMITTSASDPDTPADGLTFSFDPGAPDGAVINPETGVFTWTPTEADGPGVFEVAVRVTDSGGLFDIKSFNITVNEVNRPPVLDPIEDQAIAAGQLLQRMASATDPDIPANTLTFSLEPGAPDGATIDPVTGLFSWTPTSDQMGPHPITIRVADNGNPPLGATEPFTVTVSDPANPAPVVTATLVNDTQPDSVACFFDHNLTGFTTTQHRGSINGMGGVFSVSCQAVLREGDSFLVTLEQTFTVPDNPTQLTFNFIDLFFDTTDQFINDAFEAALVDANGLSLVSTFTAGRDAFFNITEGLGATLGTGTTLAGQTVTVDISNLTAGTTATLILRLVNNDDDTLTSVKITQIKVRGPPVASQAPIQTDALASQSPDQDNVTSDATIQGRVIDDGVVVSLRAGFDGIAVGDFVEVLDRADFQPDGSFVLEREDLEFIFGGVLPDGPHTLRLQARDDMGGLSAVFELAFTLDTQAPIASVDDFNAAAGTLDLVFDSPMADSAFTGANYTVVIDGGVASGGVLPVLQAQQLDPQTVRLHLAEPLDAQRYLITIASGVSDLAGNPIGSNTIELDVPQPIEVESVSPFNGEEMVSLTRDVLVRFDGPVDSATVTTDSFYLIANGQRIDGTIHVSSTRRFAMFFPDDPLPASTEVRVVVDGDQILTQDGRPLDADGDGQPGGLLAIDFRTVPLAQIPGTVVTGRVIASEPDASGNDVPLEGVTITVDGILGLFAVTDVDGRFELIDVPAPEFLVHIDGSTTTAVGGLPVPDSGFYPVISKPFHSVPGQTVQLEMDGQPFDIHLPFILDEAIHDVTPGQPVTVFLPATQTAEDPDLAMVALTVPADSLMREDGTAGTRVGIFRVDSDRLPAPLPDGLEHAFDITVQADAAFFDVPAPITFPNSQGLAPGETALLMSFDHAKGQWVVVGTMHVSEDGSMLIPDEGVGIRAPGWHGVQSGTVARGGLVLGQRGGLLGRTGIDELTLQTGIHYYAIQSLENGFVIRGSTRVVDRLFDSVVLAPNTPYRLSVLNLLTLHQGEVEFTTPGNGVTFTLPTVVLEQVFLTDTDGEGLNDRAEFIVGTSALLADTDADNINDLAEIRQRLDPLDGRAFPTGIIASLPLEGDARDIVLEGSIDNPEELTAYVAMGSHGLAIVDVSQFDLPVVLGQIDLDGFAVDVAVDTGLQIAAVAAGDGGLHLVNISDPMMPELLQTISVNTSLVEIVDGLVYAAVGGSLRTYDLTTGEFFDTIPISGGTLRGMAVEGVTLFTMDSNRVLQAVDTSTLVPTLLGAATLADGAGRIFVGNGIVYAAAINTNGRGGFATADVSDPNNIVPLSGSDVVAPFTAPGTDVLANGSGLALVAGSAFSGPQLNVLNVSDLTNTNDFLTRFDLAVAPNAVTIASGIAFVAGGATGLLVANYISFDNQGMAPMVSIDTPVQDADPDVEGLQVVEGTTVPVLVDITDDVQVRNVELLVNGQVVMNAVSMPFNLSLQAPRITPQANTTVVQVRAIDTGGNSTISDPIVLELVPDTIAPQVVSTNPRDNSVKALGLQRIEIEFSESMDATTVSAESIFLRDQDGNTIRPTSVQTRRNDTIVQLVFTPLGKSFYELVLDGPAVTDRAGNPLSLNPVIRRFEVDDRVTFWTSPAGGFWSDPSNWSTGDVPQDFERVFIELEGDYQITVDTEVDIVALNLGGSTGTQTLVTTHDLTVARTVLVRSNGVLQLVSGADVTTDVINEGVIEATFTSWVSSTTTRIDGSFENRPGATFRTRPIVFGMDFRPGGNISRGNMFLTVAFSEDVVNRGLFELTQGTGTFGGTANTTVSIADGAGTFLNESDGRIVSNPGQAQVGTRILRARLDNRGQVELNTTFTIDAADAQHINSGSVGVAGGMLTVTQSGDSPGFTNQGQIQIAQGQSMQVTGGLFIHAAGTIVADGRFTISQGDYQKATAAMLSGTGHIVIAGSTAEISGDFGTGLLDVDVDHSELTVTGLLTVQQNTTLTLIGDSVVNADVVNEGTVETTFTAWRSSATTRIDGSFENQAGATFRTRPIVFGVDFRPGGNINRGDMLLTVAFDQDVVNHGLFELTQGTGAFGGIANTMVLIADGGGRLLNETGGQIVSNLGEAQVGDRILHAHLDNRGAIQANTDIVLSALEGEGFNSGFIGLVGGNLFLSSLGGDNSFTNQGEIRIGQSRTLVVSNTTFVHDGGSLTGQGTAELQGGAIFDLMSNFNIEVSQFRIENSTISGNATLTIGAEKVLTLVGDSTIGTDLINEGLVDVTFTAWRSSATTRIDGSFENQAGATFRARPVVFGVDFRPTGNISRGNMSLAVAFGQDVINRGLFEMTQGTGTFGGIANTTISIAHGAGMLLNEVGGQIVSNLGEAQVGDRILQARLNNHGQVELNTSFTIHAPDAQHINSSTIDIAAGRVLNVTGGDFEQTSTGTVRIDINGSAGRLSVGDTVALAGTLNVSVAIGFFPTVGQTFQVVTFTDRGGTDFDQVTGLTDTPGVVLATTTDNNSVIVEVIQQFFAFRDRQLFNNFDSTLVLLENFDAFSNGQPVTELFDGLVEFDAPLPTVFFGGWGPGVFSGGGLIPEPRFRGRSIILDFNSPVLGVGANVFDDFDGTPRINVITLTMTTSDGQEFSLSENTPATGNAGFLGMIDSSGIVRAEFSIDNTNGNLELDLLAIKPLAGLSESAVEQTATDSLITNGASEAINNQAAQAEVATNTPVIPLVPQLDTWSPDQSRAPPSQDEDDQDPSSSTGSAEPSQPDGPTTSGNGLGRGLNADSSQPAAPASAPSIPAGANALASNDAIINAQNNIPGTNHLGTDFWLTFPASFAATSGPFQLQLLMTGDQPTVGVVEISGLDFIASFSVTPGTVTTVTLPRLADLGFEPDAIADKGIHVVSGQPTSVYGVSRGPESSDGFLALPTDTLGTEHIVLTYQNVDLTPNVFETFPGTEFAIVATQDNTTVTITPSVTTGIREAGVPFVVTLGRGQTYQLQNFGFEPADLTGTVIVSDKPVAVFAGHAAANIPAPAVSFADYLVEQLLPVTAWGSEFVTGPLATHSGDTFRFLASTDATVLTIDGVQAATLDRGQFHEQILTEAAYVTASAPILVAQFAHSTAFDNATGDPFMMLVPAVDRFVNEVTFANVVPGATVHFVNLVVPQAAVGQVELDGVILSTDIFEAVGSSGFFGAQITLEPGLHTVLSPEPVGVFVYGFGVDEGYGYPAGVTLPSPPQPQVAAVMLEPSSASKLVGETHTLLATVTDTNGDPIEGVRVDFTVSGANQAEGFDLTDEAGIARFTYVGTQPGQDTIVATVDVVSDEASAQWDVLPLSITIIDPADGAEQTAGQSVLVTGRATSASPGTAITAVTVNGQPVDIIDAAGNFFTTVLVVQGQNTFSFTAQDSFGQTASTQLTLRGLVSPQAGFSLFTHDVTPSLNAVYGRTSFNELTDTLFADLAVLNTGRHETDIPLLVLLDNISAPSVHLVGADGATPEGIPYYDFTGQVQGSTLLPGQQTSFRSLQFLNSDRVRFTFDLRFVSQLNEAPTVTSVPVVEAVVGRQYVYLVEGLDPENDALTFSLDTAPFEMTVDPQAGRLLWTPGRDDLGNHLIEVRVEDGRGGSVVQRFTLGVIDPPPNRPPVFTAGPNVNANVNTLYTYQPTIADPDGVEVTTLTFELVESPAGMTIDTTTGLLSWTPFAAQRGLHDVTLRVADGQGGTATQAFTIGVGQEAGNHEPVLFTTPPTAALTGGTYRYDAAAIDADFDTLVFSLDEAPAGMTIHTITGEVVWAVSTNDIGSHEIIVRVEDGRGGFDIQAFAIDVISNTAPVITSAAPSQGLVGQTFGYFVVASDADSDPLVFELTEAPQGITVDEDSGLVLWEPSDTQIGMHTVTVRVEDDKGGFSEQSFDVEVVAPGPNAGPQITSDPLTDAVVDRRYSYRVIATDPNGDFLRFALTDAPGGMVIDPFTGLITWTPTGAESLAPVQDPRFEIAGVASVTVEVTDGRGGIDEQSYDIIVREVDNLPPRIDSVPPPDGVFGQLYVYQVTAEDPVNDPLTFQLVNGPEGMTIDPQTGLLVWVPTVEQVGLSAERNFGVCSSSAGPCGDIVVRVDDGRGGFDVQVFPIVVFLTNTPPVITSLPPTQAFVGLPYQYQAVAQDAEDDPLTFRLDTGPAGMTIDPDTGLVTWTPTNGQLGDHDVVIVVSDGSGIDATQSAMITVAEPQDNNAPTITSQPRTLIGLGQVYIYAVQATDPDNDQLTVLLIDGPEGMAIQNGRVLTWQPTDQQLGSNPVTVRVTDGRGGVADQSFVVQVVEAQGQNSPPAIVSVPVFTAAVGRPYEYAAAAIDPDGDPLVWNLGQSPSGMSIGQVTGLVRWTPTSQQIGNHQVVVQVTDAQGGSASQAFDVVVRAVNTPLVITSLPPTRATAGVLYGYPVAASDEDNDRLIFELVSSPQGMDINADNGLILWTPQPTDAGFHEVQVRVTDTRGAFASQTFTLLVADAQNPNQAPRMTSSPPFVAFAGQTYRYQPVATDPDGDELTFALGSPDGLPAGISVDPTTGQVLWTPTADQVGTHRVSLSANDPFGGRATQSYTINVRGANQPPVIVSQPVLGAVVGQMYRYDVLVQEPDGDPVSFLLDAGPDGMTIDAQGRVVWSPMLAELGLHDVQITVSDSLGGTAIQAFSVAVVTQEQQDTNRAPIASIDNLFQPDSADPRSLESTLTVIREGLFELFGTADDPDLADIVFYRLDILDRVTDQVVRNVTPGSLNNAGFVQRRVSAGGSLGELDFTLVRSGTYTLRLTVRSGLDQTQASARFILDSQLKVGQFTFSEQDLIIPVSGVPLSVIRTYDSLNPNPGAFGVGWTFSVNDLDIQVDQEMINTRFLGWEPIDEDHLPIRFDAINNRNVTLTLPDSGRRVTFAFRLRPATGGNNPLFGPTFEWEAAFVAPPGVNATLETLQQEKFVQVGGLTFWNNAGIQHPFETYDFSGYRLTLQDGTVYEIRREFQGNGFLFFGSDGRQVVLGPVYGDLFLDRIITRNGDQLRFQRDADLGLDRINHFNALGQQTRSLVFERDEQDRITAIFDPNNLDEAGNIPANALPAVRYEYDAIGNLRFVRKLVDPDAAPDNRYLTTEYQYTDARFPHLITDIVDPRGITPFKSFYDDQGRLIATEDAFGNRIELGHDIAGRTETVFDRLGNPTVHTYDDRGNVLRTIDPEGIITIRTYNEFDDEESTTIVMGNGPDNVTGENDDLTTTFTYDGRGNQTSIKDPLGNLTTFTYDNFGNVLTTTVVMGDGLDSETGEDDDLITTSTYDDIRGNLTSTEDALGNITKFVYDGFGNLVATIDADEVTTATFAYDRAGNLVETTDAAGVTRTFTYDTNGNQTSSSFTWVNPDDPTDTRVVTTRTFYDAVGRVIRTIDADNNESVTQYDVSGNPIRTTDVLDNVTVNTYDARGNLIQTQFPDDTITRTVYDEEGRVIYSVDRYAPTMPNGPPPPGTRGTHTVYDRAGRVIRTERVADLVIDIVDRAGTSASVYVSDSGVISSTSSEFDNAGRVTASTDADNETTRFEYDKAGRQTAVIDALDNRTETQYDQAGRQTLVRDALLRETTFEYDDLGRLTKTIFHDGTFTQTIYDNLGRRIAEIDQTGKRRDFVYDALGRLIAVELPAVPDPQNNDELTRPRYEYGYDIYGNQTLIRDPLGRETRFTFDSQNRQLSRTLPGAEGNTEHFEYDEFGRIDRQIDFEGQVTQFVYDDTSGGLGRQTEKRLAQTVADADAGNFEVVITTTYDELGRQETVNDPRRAPESSGTTTFTYDADGRITQIDSPEGVINYEYDVAISGGGRQTRVFTDFTDVHYTYDALGRLATVETHKVNGVELAVPEVTAYTYTAVGSRETTTLPNGVTTTNTFDDLNRLTNVTITDDAGTLLASYTYTLRDDGRRQSVLERRLEDDGTESQVNVIYTYDALNRLTREESVVLAGDLPERQFITDYVYDLVGNRLSKVTTPGSGDTTTTTTTYVYNDADQLLTETTVTSGGGGTTVSTYEYDDNGSLIVKRVDGQVVAQYTYSLEQRLETATTFATNDQGQAVVTVTGYLYDQAGIRVRAMTTVTVDGVEQSVTEQVFLVDPLNPTGFAQVLETRDGSPSGGGVPGVPVVTYIIGDDVLYQVNGTSGGGARLFFGYDGHGSVRFLTDATSGAGGVVERYDYDAYGNALNFDPSAASTVLLYTGEQFDTNVQQYYLRARYYDAAVGRFNRLDPFRGNVIDPQSLHKYAYVHGDPINATDPSGLFPIFTAVATVGIISILSAINIDLSQSQLVGAKQLKEEKVVVIQVTTTIRGNSIVAGDKSIHILPVDVKKGVVLWGQERQIIGNTLGIPGFGWLFAESKTEGDNLTLRLTTGGIRTSLPGPFGNIDYDFTLRFNRRNGNATLIGAHDGFPSYNVKLDDVSVYDREQGQLGELFGDSDVDVPITVIMRNFNPVSF